MKAKGLEEWMGYGGDYVGVNLDNEFPKLIIR